MLKERIRASDIWVEHILVLTRPALIHPGVPPSPTLKAKLDGPILVRTASMQADPVLGSRTLAHVEQQVHPTHKCA